jgi:hypothetical protein
MEQRRKLVLLMQTSLHKKSLRWAKVEKLKVLFLLCLENERHGKAANTKRPGIFLTCRILI